MVEKNRTRRIYETLLLVEVALMASAKDVRTAGSKRKHEETAPEEYPESASVFVKGLPYDANDESIRELFSKCGAIVELDAPTFEDSGRCRGFAKLTFSSVDEAKAAIALHNVKVGGRNIGVTFARPPRADGGAAAPTKTVFVANLSAEADESALRAVFDECGEIAAVRIALDRETGAPRGFACVEFVDAECSARAMDRAGTVICGQAVRVDYAVERESSGANRGRGGGGARDRSGGHENRGSRGGRGGGGTWRGGDRGRGFGRGGSGGRGSRGGRGGRGAR